ncbi:MAG: hypothetical protein CMI56_00860 [Parcubacteria group bacterium]|nr:hypothetical protein [Parcubacteria group bacterium]|tara:strand:- start:810 stop:2714 length:1905 start_codon:yes stop_codon:yes gene_type:complete
MDVLSELSKGVGCAADGPQARNPLSSAIGAISNSMPIGMAFQSRLPLQLQQQQQHPQQMSLKLAEQQHHHQSAQFAQEFRERAAAAGNFASAQHAQNMQAAWAQKQHENMASAFAQAAQRGLVQGPPRAQLSHAPLPPPTMMGMRGGMGMGMMPHPMAMQLQHPIAMAQPARPIQQQPVYQTARQQPPVAVEECKVVESSGRGATADSAGNVARLLQSAPDARIRESEFARFMADVDSGELRIDEKGNAVVAGEKTRTNIVTDNASQIDTEYPALKRMEEAWKAALERTGEGGDMDDLNVDQFWSDVMQQTNYNGVSTIDSETKNTIALGPDLNYEMEKENPYYEKTNKTERVEETELMKRGHTFFSQGLLKEAILCFQAAARHRDDNAEAWRMLGQSHAEHDEDRKAIACLERAVERDPYNLDALLALGVSHVNELDQNNALRTLRAWVQHNPSFAGLEVEQDAYSDGSLMDEVMQLMLKAQAHSPNDPYVPEVLGVLYNVSRDYDSAINAFRQALERRPKDYTLWNKLGATQANSARSGSAMPDYHRALEIKPKYARGWLNLGIAHANVSEYAEASRCYLAALALNPEAKHIWSYLRIAFTCIERYDLAAKVSKQDVALFADEYDIPFFASR